MFDLKAGPLRLKQLTNTLSIRILSETSILYLIFDLLCSVILICGSPPVKMYVNSGFACKFRKALRALRNLQMDPLSFIPLWETKKWIQSLNLLTLWSLVYSGRRWLLVPLSFCTCSPHRMVAASRTQTACHTRWVYIYRGKMFNSKLGTLIHLNVQMIPIAW